MNIVGGYRLRHHFHYLSNDYYYILPLRLPTYPTYFIVPCGALAGTFDRFYQLQSVASA